MSTIINRKSGFLCSAVLALVLVIAACTGTEGVADTESAVDTVGEFAAPAIDPDGDGYPTTVEISYGTDPFNAASQPPDVDGDKIPDPEDPDIDGDGVDNDGDAFPYNPDEQLDTDGDGQGDNSDADDDGDGFPDLLEGEHDTDPLDPLSKPADLDGDGVPDAADPDLDGDGFANADDAFPEMANE